MLVGNFIRVTRKVGSILFDGWIVPIAYSRLPMLLLLTEFASPVRNPPLTPKTYKLFKQLRPRAVESCRRSWIRTPTCAYLEDGRAPVSTSDWESPICGCGEGKDIKDFPMQTCGAGFEEIATRVAIPMLSAVSYVEHMASQSRFA